MLLHGGLGAGEMFGPALVRLADDHQVIPVDLQGHGHTADVDRPIGSDTMAEDIAALLDLLGLGQADAVGYSLGGGVAFQLAVRYPRRSAGSSSCPPTSATTRSTRRCVRSRPRSNAAAAEFMKETPMYELYARVAPRPEDFPRLLDKIGD